MYTGIKTHNVLRFQLDKLDINDNVDGDIALPDNPTDSAVLVQQPVNVAAVEKASLPVGRAAEPTDSVAPHRKGSKKPPKKMWNAWEMPRHQCPLTDRLAGQ